MDDGQSPYTPGHHHNGYHPAEPIPYPMAHSLATSGGRLRVIPLDSPEDEDDDDDDRAPQQEVSPQGSKMRMRFNKVFTPFVSGCVFLRS